MFSFHCEVPLFPYNSSFITFHTLRDQQNNIMDNCLKTRSPVCNSRKEQEPRTAFKINLWECLSFSESGLTPSDIVFYLTVNPPGAEPVGLTSE